MLYFEVIHASDVQLSRSERERQSDVAALIRGDIGVCPAGRMQLEIARCPLFRPCSHHAAEDLVLWRLNNPHADPYRKVLALVGRVEQTEVDRWVAEVRLDGQCSVQLVVPARLVDPAERAGDLDLGPVGEICSFAPASPAPSRNARNEAHEVLTEVARVDLCRLAGDVLPAHQLTVLANHGVLDERLGEAAASLFVQVRHGRFKIHGAKLAHGRKLISEVVRD